MLHTSPSKSLLQGRKLALDGLATIAGPPTAETIQKKAGAMCRPCVSSKRAVAAKPCHKYHPTTIGTTRMNYLSPDAILDAKRQSIRDSLDQIVSEIHAAVVEAGLHYPIYVSVPSSGQPLCVSACNFDPLSRGIGVQN
jgi:hypothetical protein